MRAPFVRSAENLSDFFTKPLPKATFFAMRDIIMNVRVADTALSSTGGGVEHNIVLRRSHIVLR